MFMLKINTKNAAFANDSDDVDPKGARGAEVARILRQIAKTVEGQADGTGFAVDVNGNHVGIWTLTNR